MKDPLLPLLRMTDRTALAAVVLLFTLIAGCAGMGDAVDASSESTPDSTEIVGQTQASEQATPGGVTMPLDREVRLLDSPQAPVSDDVRSSAAYAERVKRDSATSSVENVDQKVEDLLSRMTLEEKVGQMTQLEIGTITDSHGFPEPINEDKLREVIRDHHVGSILNVGGGAYTLDHWEEIISAIQNEAAETRLKIPVLYGIDAVHGANYTQEAVLFPQNQGLAATWNPALAQEEAAITARDVRASGIPWDFSPVLGVGREPRWPRLYETLGEDVHLTTVMGLALVHGYQGEDVSQPDRVAASLKHYIGYTAPETGLDRTPARIPEVELREEYLPPFRAAIEAGAKSLMINSGEVNGVPVHASSYLLTDLLRDELGFEGVVVSDWRDIKKLIGVHHVAEDEREATKMAIMAGVDMSMVPHNYSFYKTLLSLVRDGEIPGSRIDESVRRILRLKYELGLFEDPLRGMAQAEDVGSEHDRRVSLQAARESVTLLRNDDDLLPLGDGQRVLVTGPTAHSMQALHNGWTYTWQGTGRLAQRMFPEGRPTIMEAIREKVGEEQMSYVPGATLTSARGLDKAVAAARQAEVAVVALGEGAYAETPGDIGNLMLPEAQRKLLKRVAATGTPVALVLVEGRPRVLGDAAGDADAILNAYNPGPEGGQAIMEVLYGDVNPSGHLPYTYPRAPVRTVTYDRKYSENQDAEGGMNGFDPLFTFGSGLSYTNFAYSDLSVSRASMDEEAVDDGGTVQVSVTVANTGDRRGKDVIQLYVSDLVASVTPSVQELKRFAKVDLAPGQSTELSFALGKDDFGLIGRDGNSVLETGTFRIRVDTLVRSFALK